MENEKVKSFISKLKSSISTVPTSTEEIPLNLNVLLEELGQRSSNNKDRLVENCMRLVEKRRVDLREEREKVCFSVVNRGQVWYDTLTEPQHKELTLWYKAWLDVTKTLVAPVTPEWLQ